MWRTPPRRLSGELDPPVAACPARLVAAGELEARVLGELVVLDADAVHAEPERPGVAVARGLPAVEAGVERERLARLDHQRSSWREPRDGGLLAPEPGRRRRSGAAVALLDRLQQLDLPLRRPRRVQLQVLAVRPDERHRAAARLAREEVAFGDRLGVPDLLGDQAAAAAHARHRLEVRGRVLAAEERRVAALAGEQRPGAADAAAVEGAAVCVLAVAVAFVAAVGDTGRQLCAQLAVDDGEGGSDPRVVRVAQAEP